MIIDSLTGDRFPTIWDVTTPRLNKLCREAWQQLPDDTREALLNYQVKVREVAKWPDHVRIGMKMLNVKHNHAKFNQFDRQVDISAEDCSLISDDVLTGVFVHELAHAYQACICPDNIEAIDSAGDTLPRKWGFSRQIAALQAQRVNDSEVPP